MCSCWCCCSALELRLRGTSKKNVKYAFTLAAVVVGFSLVMHSHRFSDQNDWEKIDKTNTKKKKKYKSNCACVWVRANLFRGLLTDTCVRNIFGFFFLFVQFYSRRIYFLDFVHSAKPPSSYIEFFHIAVFRSFICYFHCFAALRMMNRQRLTLVIIIFLSIKILPVSDGYRLMV